MYFGKNIADRSESEMDKKRVLINFDYDNDRLLHVIRRYALLELAQKCSHILSIG
jgi:hypothetical protein